MPKFPRLSIFLVLVALFMGACSPGAAESPDSGTTAGATLPSPEQVTPTQAAAAARVNGEEISQDSYEVNRGLYQAAQIEAGTLLATEDMQQAVLDALVERLLLAQGARAAGFSADRVLEQRLASLIEETGGQVALDEWINSHGYNSELFRAELALEIEAAHMRDLIAAEVATTAEQVQARQILLADKFQAERLLGQLENGTPFEQVVQNNDPTRLGSLGWFPRGYLLQPAVEDAAFALQPGEYSGIVETELGFHLIEVLDRDPARPLTPQARLQLQAQSVQDWLAQQRAQSEIAIFLP